MNHKTNRLTGTERIMGTDLSLKDDHILDFWSWSCSNLMMNDTRGVLAEWLVARLLHIPLETRISWDAYDLITSEGVKIEVKASALCQDWSQKKDSDLKFSGLKGQIYDYDSNTYNGIASFNADLYVFCTHIEKDKDKYNALDLRQWRFFFLSKEVLMALDQDSISLNPLKKLCPEMDAATFQARTLEKIREIAANRVSTARTTKENPALI